VLTIALAVAYHATELPIAPQLAKALSVVMYNTLVYCTSLTKKPSTYPSFLQLAVNSEDTKGCMQRSVTCTKRNMYLRTCNSRPMVSRTTHSLTRLFGPDDSGGDGNQADKDITKYTRSASVRNA